jgi:hypothetical protein
MSRRRFRLPLSEEQKKANRKERRQMRELKKKDPQAATKLWWDKFKEDQARSEVLLNKWREEKKVIIARLPKYLSYREISCPTKYHPENVGGVITCKLCGKEYRWEYDWGRTRKAAITRMGMHLDKAHQVNDLGHGWATIEIDEWAAAEDKKIEEAKKK